MTHIFPPSKGEVRWRATSYLFAAGVGAYTLLSPSLDVVEQRLGYIVPIWGLFMLTAIPGAVSVLVGRYRIEAILLPFFGSALVVAAITAWVRIFGEGQEELIGRACIASSLVCLLVVRFLQLHRIVKAEPWITTGP